MYRQGDVFVIKSSIPKDAKKVNGRIILAEGEVTGHHHAISVIDETICKAYEKDGIMYLHIEAPVDLVHEEHGPITIPPGDYMSYIQREYDVISSRRVAD